MPFLIFSSCSEAPTKNEHSFTTTAFKEVLFGDDHTSEGFLASLEDGRVLLIFRFDPGMEGDHVGRDGYIAQIMYDPENDEWGDVKTVYNSHSYDDRNIHGGVTRDGRIVVFFRQYDGQNTVGKFFLTSDDAGESWNGPHESEVWSDPDEPELQVTIFGTGQMFYNPDIDRYATLGYQRHVNSIIYSVDGTSWNEYNLVKEDRDTDLTEIAGAWTGSGRIIALIRDDRRERGHTLLQVESYDNGESWTEPARTNIPPDRHWGAAPQLIYDSGKDLLIALNSDRYTRDVSEQSLFIYTGRPDQVFGKPENWTLEYELLRPWAADDFDGDRPLNQSFYGYPTIASINESEYLVVFTERASMDGSEQADLYYFRIVFADPP